MTAEEIVRRFAAADPNHHSYMWHECVLCDASTPVRAEDHKKDCVWRLAVEWTLSEKDTP